MYYIMSSVENLNKIFLEFCDDLENVVPSKKELIDNARKRVEEKSSTKYYLEYYFRHCLEYAEDVTQCNAEALSDMNMIHGVKFGEVYNGGLQLQSRHALWRYMHTFYLLVQSFPKIDKVVEKYAKNENIGKIKKALSAHDRNLKNIMDSSAKFAEEIIRENVKPDAQMPDMSEFMKGMDEKQFEEKFLNSSIGNLAKEISEGLGADDLKSMENPEDMMKNLMSGQNGGLGNIINKVSSTLQQKMQSGELNEEMLMKEATQMMGMLGPMMGGSMPNAKGMEGMGDLFSMMGGMMGGSKKKKGKKSGGSKHR